MLTARTSTFLASLACLLLLAPCCWRNPSLPATMAGTVTDPSGGVIPGASVVLRNAGTGASQETTTNAQGFYRFPLLSPGSYTVTANAPSFAETIRTARVSVGQTNVVDVQLSLQTAVMSIDVHEQVVTIQPASPNISHNVGAQPLANVPNPGNDLTFYALLSPGVEMSTNGGFGNFSTFGLPALSNTFTLNGGINNDVFSNIGNTGATNLMLGFNAIGEVTVVNNAYSGQYGGLAGSQVNYVFKSGTNNYHGNAIYFWNGRAMNANNWFNNQAGDPRPFSNVNTWATSVGGPLPKQQNKTFYFFDYEGTRIVLPTNTLARIPSPQFAAATLDNLSATGQTQAVSFYQNIFKLYAGAAGANTAIPVPGRRLRKLHPAGPRRTLRAAVPLQRGQLHERVCLDDARGSQPRQQRPHIRRVAARQRNAGHLYRPDQPDLQRLQPAACVERADQRESHVQQHRGQPVDTHRTVLQHALWAAGLRRGAGRISHGDPLCCGPVQQHGRYRLSMAPGPECDAVPAHRRFELDERARIT